MATAVQHAAGALRSTMSDAMMASSGSADAICMASRRGGSAAGHGTADALSNTSSCEAECGCASAPPSSSRCLYSQPWCVASELITCCTLRVAVRGIGRSIQMVQPVPLWEADARRRRRNRGVAAAMDAPGADEVAVSASGAAVAFACGLRGGRGCLNVHGIHVLLLSASSVASACTSLCPCRGTSTVRSPAPPSCRVQRQHNKSCSGGGGTISGSLGGIPASRKRVHDVMDGEASAAACEAM